jgi:hypothetical protein
MTGRGHSPEQPRPIPGVDKPSLPRELEIEYRKQREQIKQLYRNVWVWHGTGRYDRRGDTTVDVLGEIVSPDEEGHPRGFLPHKDVWAGNEQETISATVTRPYATLYSDMHFVQGAEEMVFKDKRRLQLARRTAPHALSLIRRLPHILRQRQTAAKWMEEKTGEKVEGNIWKAAIKFGSRRSTLPGDYPILVGFKPGAFEPISVPGYIAATEVRTDKPISLDHVSHFEVPLRNVAETIAFFEEKGIAVPILPREFGERYSSEFTDEEIVTGKGFLK